MKIAVSIGHTLSGADSGAAKYLNESKCTREIGSLVDSKLRAQGHNVVLCRIDSASSVGESLAYRVNKANAANVDLFVEIHLNAGGGTGSETWIAGSGSTSEGYARKIVNALCELGFANRGVKVGNFYVLNKTKAPAVLVECCFVDSQADANRYNANNIAEKIVFGITGKKTDNGVPNEDLACDAVAIEDCVVNRGSLGKGAIYEQELFKWNYTTGAEDGYKKHVDYMGAEGYVKSGYIESGSVVHIDDAYNYYNCSNAVIEAFKDSGLTEKQGGVIYGEEKVFVSSIKNGVAYVRFDSSQYGKLRHLGYVDSKLLCKIGEKPPVIEPPVVEPPSVLYRVQVGVFSQRENAEKLVGDLKAKGFDGVIKVVTENEKVTYRVQVGAFSKKENADALLNDLKANGFDGFIKQE